MTVCSTGTVSKRVYGTEVINTCCILAPHRPNPPLQAHMSATSAQPGVIIGQHGPNLGPIWPQLGSNMPQRLGATSAQVEVDMPSRWGSEILKTLLMTSVSHVFGTDDMSLRSVPHVGPHFEKGSQVPSCPMLNMTWTLKHNLGQVRPFWAQPGPKLGPPRANFADSMRHTENFFLPLIPTFSNVFSH